MGLNRVHHITSRLVIYLQAALLCVPIFVGSIPTVNAAELQNRSIRISTSRLGAQARHIFSFDVASNTPIASISFTYCTNSPWFSDPCTPPAGLDLSSLQFTDQNTNTGFAYAAPYSNSNTIVISRPVAAGIPGASSYWFDDITNPTTSGETTFVRIATFATPDATGPATDRGVVTFATQDVFQISAYVPPFLTFCVGVFVTLNCNSVTGSYIDIGELGPDRTATGLMQFSGGTNDSAGYTTYMNGFTMTSGNNIISPLESNANSTVGASQFGLNLRANSNPNFGLDPVGAGNTVPAAGYSIPNSYRFVNGEAITSSATSTDFKVFTAAFIVNVSKDQPAGVYVTTMTYTAVASF